MDFFQKARSNNFLVKDEKKFEDLVCVFKGITLEKSSDGAIALFSDEDRGGAGWGGTDKDGKPIDLRDLVAPHLREGQVAVFMQIGWEGMRFLTGEATAINSKGEKVSVDLDEIYKLADPLGSVVSRAEY